MVASTESLLEEPMQFSLTVQGDDEHVRHLDASSAEDALRQLSDGSGDVPLRARFLSADQADGYDDPASHHATRQRRGSQDSGHTRTHLARDVRR
jgi:hypothetical protein